MAKILKFPNQTFPEEIKDLSANDNVERPDFKFIEARGVIREQFLKALDYAGEQPIDMVIKPFVSEYNENMEISVSFNKGSRASLEVMRKYRNLASQIGFAAPSYVSVNRENLSKKKSKR